MTRSLPAHRLVRLLAPASLLVLLLAVLPRGLPRAEAKEAAPDLAAAAAPARPGPFEVVREFDGALVPRHATEVAYVPRAYGGELEVVEAAAAGRVRAGQTLVVLRAEPLEHQVRMRRAEVALARTKVERQREELERVAEGARIALEQARVRARVAQEALHRFREVERPLRVHEAEHRLEGHENAIQDQEEELAQLVKMYEEDEIIEETEEIVMRRARRGLQRTKRSYEFARRRHALLLEVELPNDEERLVLESRARANDREKAEATTELGLVHARLELEKAALELTRQQEGLEDLLADRDALVLRAPVGGFAVPGTFQGGRWHKVEETERQLRPGQRVAARQVLFTLVRPGEVLVRVLVPEDSFGGAAAAACGHVRLAGAREEHAVEARVVGALPLFQDGKAEMRLQPQAAQGEDWMPGRPCKVRLVVRREADVVTVPQAAVRKVGERHRVWVLGEAGPEPRDVEVGDTSEGRTEVRSGLEPDERVLEKAPAGDGS